MEKIQESDIEIKPLKSFKGQGLCKIIENSDSLDGIISISVGEPLAYLEWYGNIVFYLRSYGNIVFYLRSMQFFVTMNPKERITLKMKENKYVFIFDILLRRNYYGIY
jgi:hypothetical protein